MKVLIPGASAVGLSVAAKLPGTRGGRKGLDSVDRAVAMMAGLIAFRESPAGGERP